MKKVFLLLVFFTIIIAGTNAQCGDALIDICHEHLGDTRFLRSFPVQLDEQSSGGSLPVQRYNMVLNAGTTYRIFACNAEEYPGKVIISLYFQDRLVGTTYLVDQRRHLPFIQFNCNTSGVYNIDFYFEDGKEGCAMGMVSSFK